MELLFNTTRIGAQLQVWDYAPEIRSMVCFGLHLRACGRRIEVEFYITEEARRNVLSQTRLYFHIRLPFVWINNDTRQEVITSSTTLKTYVVPVTVGKVFRKSIYRIKRIKEVK